MKNIIKTLTLVLVVTLIFPILGYAQDVSLKKDLKYGVHKVHPYISLTRDKVMQAQTLSDLNEYFKPSWIREFISVDLFAIYKGGIRKVTGMSDQLIPAQKELMNMADVGTEISFKVRYMPQNTLAQNDIKEINFTFVPGPEKEATYPGGQEQLDQFLKVNAIDKIPDGTFVELTLAAVKFTVDEMGQVIDAHVFESSKNKTADDLLLESILNMPKWSPAEYTNGQKTKQEFVLTVGDMENCMVNLLNIRYN